MFYQLHVTDKYTDTDHQIVRDVPPRAKRIIFGEQKFTKTCVIPLEIIFFKSSLQDEHELSVEN